MSAGLARGKVRNNVHRKNRITGVLKIGKFLHFVHGSLKRFSLKDTIKWLSFLEQSRRGECNSCNISGTKHILFTSTTQISEAKTVAKHWYMYTASSFEKKIIRKEIKINSTKSSIFFSKYKDITIDRLHEFYLSSLIPGGSVCDRKSPVPAVSARREHHWWRDRMPEAAWIRCGSWLELPACKRRVTPRSEPRRLELETPRRHPIPSRPQDLPRPQQTYPALPRCGSGPPCRTPSCLTCSSFCTCTCRTYLGLVWWHNTRQLPHN